MDPLDLAGLIVPPTTPFNENMCVDEGALAMHLEFLGKHGVTRLLINGTTGEFFSLMPEERKLLLALARRHFSGIILFNTASDSLLQSIDAARWAEECGADAIVAMAPYYYAGAPSKGLVEYFNRLGGSVKLPLVLYNFERHTNNPLSPEILDGVKHVAIKDSSGDRLLIESTSCYLAGTSRQMVEWHEAGAKGFVSSLANHQPDLYVRLEECLSDGNIDNAKKLQKEIIGRCADMESKNEIAAIKEKLSALIPGYPTRMRLPLL
ncbi:MAG: dihydrodipicolinate synthase family protein [bacterium]|nr:dihydrodipicolinate synthase family protein [bacterium]